MKIAQIISSLDVGGAEKQLLGLCGFLKQENHDVVVGCMKSGGPSAPEFRANGIPVEEFAMRGPVDFAAYFRVRRWLQKESPDIVHTHLFKADVYAGFAAQSLQIPVICSKRNEDQYLKNPFFSLLARKVASKCVRIIAISEAVKSFLINEAGFDGIPIQVIPIGIQLIPKENRRNNTVINFAVIGRLVEQKGQRFLIYAFQEAKKTIANIHLHIFGGGPDEAMLRRMISAVLDNSVTFHGILQDQDQIYRDIDAVVVPSIWEGAGNVILEAMVRGIPVIASNVGGIPEYLGDCGILVPAADVRSLSDAIVRIAEDGELRRMISQKCFERIPEFAFEKTARSHLDLYSRVYRSNDRQIQPVTNPL